MSKVFLDGDSLTLNEVVEIARNNRQVAISPLGEERINHSRKFIEDAMAENKVVYGVNTGFGEFANIVISNDRLEELQRNLILSDAVGIGAPFATEIVRALMLLRVNAVAKGYSGIRLSTANTLIEMINKGVHPIVREKGSVGSSGDLCPLAHMVMPMIGEGEAEYKGEVLPGRVAMERAGIPIVTLQAKEGLALINGTCAMMAVATLAVYDAIQLTKIADIATAISAEAICGIIDAFDEKIHLARPHSGQLNSAENLRNILKDSALMTHQGEVRTQDAYTIRCTPQIHGASRLAIDYVTKVIETEINSATDNPLIFPDTGEIFSGGNFHGQPVAIAMDALGIAVSEFANVSERRIERLVNPALSYGLPGFLTAEEGINCGFMVAQYAAAALVSENKILAHPASVDSIPTSANQEDHVSFGTTAARKARTIIDHAQHVLAIELLCGVQAADLRDKTKLSGATSAVYNTIRSEVSFMERDRAIYLDTDKVFAMVADGRIVNACESISGTLK